MSELFDQNAPHYQPPEPTPGRTGAHRPRRSKWKIALIWAVLVFGAAYLLGLALDASSDVVDTPSTLSATDGTPAPEKASSAPEKTKPKLSTARRNAIRSAEDYISFQGFSRAGLIKQLTSKYADSYSRADATYAVDHIEVDWNAEAVESARSYLDMDGFSRTGLIKQLTSKYGDGYTAKQAAHAATEVGL